MSLTFYTQQPRALLDTFKKAIKDGHVVTWSCDKDGDFTHTLEQWKNQAWMRPVIKQGGLVMNFIGNPRATKPMRELYAIYHGRFAELMLAHCDKQFDNVSASALAASGDQVSTAA